MSIFTEEQLQDAEETAIEHVLEGADEGKGGVPINSFLQAEQEGTYVNAYANEDSTGWNVEVLGETEVHAGNIEALLVLLLSIRARINGRY